MSFYDLFVESVVKVSFLCMKSLNHCSGVQKCIYQIKDNKILIFTHDDKICI